MFGVTKMAAEKFGWTNSQPLDLVDGYDLLKKAGRRLIARTLEEHDPFLTVIAFDCRIWSLMCNMNHTIDWEALRSSIGREAGQVDLLASSSTRPVLLGGEPSRLSSMGV